MFFLKFKTTKTTEKTPDKKKRNGQKQIKDFTQRDTQAYPPVFSRPIIFSEE